MQPDISLLDAALAYAAIGWAVIPLHSVEKGACSCRRPNCGRSAGKHPRIDDWVEKASKDPTVIRDWWARWPGSNVGIATGAKSGVVVLDVDPDSGGSDSLAALERAHGKLPKTVESRTGSGGRHIFFKYPDFPVKNSVKKIAPGLDVRGDGGLVVVPPSIHRSGKVYAFRKGCEPK